MSGHSMIACRLFTACLVFLAAACDEPPRTRGFAGGQIRLEVGAQRLSVEVASDEHSRRMGLMHRKKMADSHGMLFIFPSSEKRSFWMRNTLIPLSIAFLDDDGTILQIEHMRPKDESSTWSTNRVRYALEVNQGWFARNGIRVGDKFTSFEERVRPFNAS